MKKRKHSNLFNEYYLGGGRRRRKIWGWIIAVAVIAFLVWLIYQIGMASALASTGYGIAVRNCISTARELNQYATVHLDPQSCVNNPYYLK
jgi:hypothetical protein